MVLFLFTLPIDMNLGLQFKTMRRETKDYFSYSIAIVRELQSLRLTYKCKYLYPLRQVFYHALSQSLLIAVSPMICHIFKSEEGYDQRSKQANYQSLLVTSLL